MSEELYTNPYRADYVIERCSGRLPLYNIKINTHSESDIFTAEYGAAKAYAGTGIYVIGWFRYGRARATRKAEKELAKYIKGRAALDGQHAAKGHPTEIFSLDLEIRSV